MFKVKDSEISKFDISLNLPLMKRLNVLDGMDIKDALEDNKSDEVRESSKFKKNMKDISDYDLFDVYQAQDIVDNADSVTVPKALNDKEIAKRLSNIEK